MTANALSDLAGQFVCLTQQYRPKPQKALNLTLAAPKTTSISSPTSGLVKQVRIVEGSALAMPFDDGCFDRAYSQNVVMNIADKFGLYREALRVLKPGNLLALSNVAAGPNGPPRFPVPWATAPDFGEAHLRRILATYASYYNELRTHLSLDKASPGRRPTQRLGQLVARPILGGLHHHYCRI